MIIKKIIFFLILFNVGNLLAQVNCTAIIDTNVVKIGMPLNLKIAISFPKEATCSFKPTLKSDSTFEVGIVNDWQKETNEFQITLQSNYSLTFWESGEIDLPSYVFEVVYKNKPKTTCNTDPIHIKITNPKEINEPIDIKDIEREPKTWRDYMIYFIALAVLGVLLFLLFLYLKFKKKKAEKLQEEVPKLPPYELAMLRLDELESKKYLEDNLQKEFITDLTFLWRAYLEDRYQIPALESTSDELKILFKKNKNIPIDSKDLIPFLKNSDLIKFANRTIEPAVLNDYLDFVKNFIEKTKPINTEQK
jgi:hypothetical protein